MPIVLYKNIGLSDGDTNGRTSTVGEPNVANKGRRIFMTGNWYAARSFDMGLGWDAISPYSTLPPADGGFCCDQTLVYEHSRDILVWILQYVEQGGTNTLRVAINPGASLNSTDWHWWDFKPAGVNAAWTGDWFDYNHAATSDNYLYVGTNVFSAANDQFRRSVLFRFPLDALANASQLDYSYFETADNFSLRCTQGAGDTMYFGSHNSTSRLRVFSWPEDANTVSVNDVSITPWSGGSYVALGPDDRNWLGRCDSRVTGAAVANGVITFAWTVNGQDDRPLPHVRVARIDAQSMNLISEPDIWNSQYAFAYPALSPNRRGHLGISLFRGGGEFHPGHVVGVRDEARSVWDLKVTSYGSDGPVDGKWGDYLGIVPYSDNGYSWFASGFTLQGGGSRSDIEPRVTQFAFRS